MITGSSSSHRKHTSKRTPRSHARLLRSNFRAKLRSTTSLFLLTAALLLSGGCSKTEEAKKDQKIAIRLAYPPEVAPFIELVRASLESTKQRLMDGTVVDVEPIQLDTVPALERLSTGLVKTTMWLAPAQAIADHVASHVVNLGARPTECVPLFSTEVGVVSRQADRLILTRSDSTSVAQLLSPADPDGPPALNAAFVLSSPTTSSSGLLAAALLQRLQRSKEITIENIADHVLDVAPSDTDALSRVAKYEGSEVLVSLATSQAVSSFNAITGANLVFSPVTESRLATRYVLCTSDAAWVSASERTAAAQLKTFLQRPEMLSAAQASGFDAPDHAETARTELVASDLTALGEVWSALERPATLMLVVDTSGSLNGDNCGYMQKDVRSFVETLRSNSPETLLGMTIFSSAIDRVMLFTKDSSPLLQTIDAIRCRGSSIVFASTLRAIEAFQEGEFSKTRKRLLLISDGYGSAMEGEQASFVTRAGRSLVANRISMTLLGIVHEGSDLKDLPERTEAVGGVVTKASLEQLGMTLELYRAQLTDRFVNPFTP